MSFLSKLTGRFQKQVNPAIFQFFNPSSMPKMTEKEYLRAYKGWVYTATNAIAERMADIELKLETKGTDGWKEVEEHEALDLVHKVNEFTSYYDLIYGTQAYLELVGNAFWCLIYNRGGKVAEIWPLDPTRVTVVKDKAKFIRGYVFKNELGKEIPFEVDEIIHFKRFKPGDPYRGMGTLEAAAIAVDIDTYSGEWQRNFFGNSAMPSGILSTTGTLSQEQYDRIKNNWDAKYKGVANAHKMAILEGGLNWTAISPNSRDMQFSEGRKDIRDEILAYFRVPKAILGMAEDFNRANIDGIEYIFAKYVIKPKMKFFVHTLNEYYLPKFNLDSRKFRLNYADPVPENIEEKLKINESGLKNYYMTPDEARENIGHEPLKENGDRIYIQNNMRPLEMAGEESTDDDKEPKEDEDPKDDDKKGKSVVVKKNEIEGTRVPNEIDHKFVDAEVAKQHEVFLNLNTKLRKQLLKNLKNAKSADTFIKRLARAVQKDSANELVRIIFENYDDWIGLLYNATKEGMQGVLAQSGKNTLALLEINGEFDLSHPRVLDWLNEHALEDSNSYSDSIKEEIALLVQEGVELGTSNDGIAGNIAQFFENQSDYRAMRLARTETINAYGAGALEGYKQSGVVIGKYWMPDGDPCVVCAANADEGNIGLDESFQSGHSEPTAHPNCECSLGGVTAKE